MITITKENTHELHKELWQWLADNPNKNKFEWPRWKEVQEIKDREHILVPNRCFACARALLEKSPVEMCAACPIVEYRKIYYKAPEELMYRAPCEVTGTAFRKWEDLGGVMHDRMDYTERMRARREEALKMVNIEWGYDYLTAGVQYVF